MQRQEVFQGDVTLEVKQRWGAVDRSYLTAVTPQTISPTMTEPDNRQELLSHLSMGFGFSWLLQEPPL